MELDRSHTLKTSRNSIAIQCFKVDSLESSWRRPSGKRVEEKIGKVEVRWSGKKWRRLKIMRCGRVLWAACVLWEIKGTEEDDESIRGSNRKQLQRTKSTTQGPAWASSSSSSLSEHLQPSGLDVVRGIGALRELNEVDLDVVPAIDQFERQRADERTNFGPICHAAGVKPPPNVAVVQHLQSVNETRNSSADEIANVNFLYDDIVHVLQSTAPSRNCKTRHSYNANP